MQGIMIFIRTASLGGAIMSPTRTRSMSRIKAVSSVISKATRPSHSSRGYATVLDMANLLKTSNAAAGTGFKRPIKRFWEKANIKTTEEGYQINLDVRPIRTSSGHPLVVPHNKTALAHLIVQEWATLPSLQIKPHSLPLTSLAARAIDITKSEDPEATKESIVNALLPYLDTDTMLIFAPSEEYNGALRKAQEDIYRPMISWAEEQVFGGAKLSFSDGDKGLTGNMQSESIKGEAAAWANSLDVWQLTAFERTVLAGKSFLGGIKLVNRQISTSELADAVTLEVLYQMKRWGEVEDSHDVDWADIRRQIASAAVLVITD
ncbi:hypothetical protein V1525DRAFT_373006 [Lipomyces kononenkoae]|uniref:Uncharacterized protein n=1 Tax=Lipomyces kononenkoae TaxID=34357 RepID=A0ACC3T619_LIPKO